jgi:hypothetical protein
MHVILAGLFVFGGILLAVCLLGPVLDCGSHTASGILIGILMGGLFLALIVAAQVLFNWPIDWRRERFSFEQYIEDLENKGLLISTDYQAIRAFQLEEYEDEGSHYFVELTDRTVLYLTGQDLYEYGPIDDDPELSQPRRFPCTDFSLRSHRDEHGYIDIQCRGTVIEPELVDPHPKHVWKRGLKDGEVIADMSFDEVKAQLITEGKRR